MHTVSLISSFDFRTRRCCTFHTSNSKHNTRLSNRTFQVHNNIRNPKCANSSDGARNQRRHVARRKYWVFYQRLYKNTNFNIALTILSRHPCIAEQANLQPTCVYDAGRLPDLVSFFVTGLSKQTKLAPINLCFIIIY